MEHIRQTSNKISIKALYHAEKSQKSTKIERKMIKKQLSLRSRSVNNKNSSKASRSPGAWPQAEKAKNAQKTTQNSHFSKFEPEHPHPKKTLKSLKNLSCANLSSSSHSATLKNMVKSFSRPNLKPKRAPGSGRGPPASKNAGNKENQKYYNHSRDGSLRDLLKGATQSKIGKSPKNAQSKSEVHRGMRKVSSMSHMMSPTFKPKTKKAQKMPGGPILSNSAIHQKFMSRYFGSQKGSPRAHPASGLACKGPLNHRFDQQRPYKRKLEKQSGSLGKENSRPVSDGSQSMRTLNSFSNLLSKEISKEGSTGPQSGLLKSGSVKDKAHVLGNLLDKGNKIPGVIFTGEVLKVKFDKNFYKKSSKSSNDLDAEKSHKLPPGSPEQGGRTHRPPQYSPLMKVPIGRRGYSGGPSGPGMLSQGPYMGFSGSIGKSSGTNHNMKVGRDSRIFVGDSGHDRASLALNGPDLSADGLDASHVNSSPRIQSMEPNLGVSSHRSQKSDPCNKIKQETVQGPRRKARKGVSAHSKTRSTGGATQAQQAQKTQKTKQERSHPVHNSISYRSRVKLSSRNDQKESSGSYRRTIRSLDFENFRGSKMEEKSFKDSERMAIKPNKRRQSENLLMRSRPGLTKNLRARSPGAVGRHREEPFERKDAVFKRVFGPYEVNGGSGVDGGGGGAERAVRLAAEDLVAPSSNKDVQEWIKKLQKDNNASFVENPKNLKFEISKQNQPEEEPKNSVSDNREVQSKPPKPQKQKSALESLKSQKVDLMALNRSLEELATNQPKTGIVPEMTTSKELGEVEQTILAEEITNFDQVANPATNPNLSNFLAVQMEDRDHVDLPIQEMSPSRHENLQNSLKVPEKDYMPITRKSAKKKGITTINPDQASSKDLTHAQKYYTQSPGALATTNPKSSLLYMRESGLDIIVEDHEEEREKSSPGAYSHHSASDKMLNTQEFFRMANLTGFENLSQSRKNELEQGSELFRITGLTSASLKFKEMSKATENESRRLDFENCKTAPDFNQKSSESDRETRDERVELPYPHETPSNHPNGPNSQYGQFQAHGHILNSKKRNQDAIRDYLEDQLKKSSSKHNNLVEPDSERSRTTPPKLGRRVAKRLPGASKGVTGDLNNSQNLHNLTKSKQSLQEDSKIQKTAENCFILSPAQQTTGQATAKQSAEANSYLTYSTNPLIKKMRDGGQGQFIAFEMPDTPSNLPTVDHEDWTRDLKSEGALLDHPKLFQSEDIHLKQVKSEENVKASRIVNNLKIMQSFQCGGEESTQGRKSTLRGSLEDSAEFFVSMNLGPNSRALMRKSRLGSQQQRHFVDEEEYGQSPSYSCCNESDFDRSRLGVSGGVSAREKGCGSSGGVSGRTRSLVEPSITLDSMQVRFMVLENEHLKKENAELRRRLEELSGGGKDLPDTNKDGLEVKGAEDRAQNGKNLNLSKIGKKSKKRSNGQKSRSRGARKGAGSRQKGLRKPGINIGAPAATTKSLLDSAVFGAGFGSSYISSSQRRVFGGNRLRSQPGITTKPLTKKGGSRDRRRSPETRIRGRKHSGTISGSQPVNPFIKKLQKGSQTSPLKNPKNGQNDKDSANRVEELTQKTTKILKELEDCKDELQKVQKKKDKYKRRRRELKNLLFEKERLLVSQRNELTSLRTVIGVMGIKMKDSAEIENSRKTQEETTLWQGSDSASSFEGESRSVSPLYLIHSRKGKGGNDLGKNGKRGVKKAVEVPPLFGKLAAVDFRVESQLDNARVCLLDVKNLDQK